MTLAAHALKIHHLWQSRQDSAGCHKKRRGSPLQLTSLFLTVVGCKVTPSLDLLVSWIDRIIQKMNGTVDNLEDQVLALEDHVLDGDSSGIRPVLSSLRRQCIAFRRYLTPLREISCLSFDAGQKHLHIFIFASIFVQ